MPTSSPLNIASLKPASGKPWKLRAEGGEADRFVDAVMQRYGLPEALARVVAGRDVPLEHVGAFLSPTLRDLLPDPSHLKDMDAALKRIHAAIQAQETIAIFGDYDVDGATSTALLINYFESIGVNTLFHIPDRIEEGYGPNSEAFKALQAKGAQLIITVDCGTVSYEPIKTACDLGLDVIVVDHHIGGETLPDAVAVINPNRLDETSDYGHLCAAGVVFLMLVGLNRALRKERFFSPPHLTSPRKQGEEQTTPPPVHGGRQGGGKPPEPDLRQWLDLVALGTVCDVVPLKTLNRAYVSQGLQILRQRHNIGLSALCDVARVNEEPNPYTLGFLLGPRINAGGRVGNASLGAQLLSGHDQDIAISIAHQLDQYNAERKAIEFSVLEEAKEMAASQANQPMIMVAKEGWHPGVIGIVAGRLKEQFDRPAAVIAIDENGEGKASARSVSGVDVGTAITRAKQEGLLLAGGGHAMAGGFSLEIKQFDALYAYFCEHLASDIAAYQATSSRSFDSFLSVSGASVDFIEEMESLGPYGMGCPSPKIVIPNARIVRRDVLKEEHIRLKIVDDGAGQKEGYALTALAFRSIGTLMGDMLMNDHYKTVSLLGSLKVNEWNGHVSAQLMIDDAAV